MAHNLEQPNEEEDRPAWLDDDYKVPRLDTIAPSPQISPGKDVKPVHEANTSTPSLNTSEGTPLLSNSKMKQQKQKKKSKSTKKKIQRKITLMAQRTCCHSFFILISTYSCISIIFLMISQSLPLMLIPIETLQILLRVYILFFCLFLLIAESNKNWFGIQQTFISQNWMMKGIFHSFLGLIAVEQSVAMDVHDTDSAMNRKDHMGWIEGFGNHNVVTALEIFINTSSWMMVASGAVYFLMGLLCLKNVRDKCEHEYKLAVEKHEIRQQIEKEELDANYDWRV